MYIEVYDRREKCVADKWQPSGSSILTSYLFSMFVQHFWWRYLLQSQKRRCFPWFLADVVGNFELSQKEPSKMSGKRQESLDLLKLKMTHRALCLSEVQSHFDSRWLFTAANSVDLFAYILNKRLHYKWQERLRRSIIFLTRAALNQSQQLLA